jgi:hypothetical protein
MWLGVSVPPGDQMTWCRRLFGGATVDCAGTSPYHFNIGRFDHSVCEFSYNDRNFVGGLWQATVGAETWVAHHGAQMAGNVLQGFPTR